MMTKRFRWALGPLTAMLLLVATLLAPGWAAAKTPTPAASAALDARLGGTQTSFRAAFGKPVKGKSTKTVDAYAVKGFGLVAAAFLSSRADEITLAADRLAHTPLTTPDPADWSVTNAAKFADAVAPTDATYGAPAQSAAAIELAGHSQALAAVFTQADLTTLQVGGAPGDFTVVYHLDTAGSVFSVDLSVGAPATTADSGAATTGAATKTTASATKTTGSGSTGAAGGKVYCRDFATQAEAQAYFDAHGGDSNPQVSGMDGDKDGKPCESLP